MIGSLPFAVGAAGWISMYLSAAATGTDEAWRTFVEAEVGAVVGFGMTVAFLPLLAQPALLAMVAAELVILRWAARVASIVGRRYDLDRRLGEGVGALTTRERPKVDPYLALLIECKRAELPYVFFLSSSKVDAPDFPLITGVPKLDVRVASTGATYSGVRMPETLSLDADDFVRNAEYCTTFAKCARKGKKLELSSSEGYNSLVLPLSKALHHFDAIRAPEPEVPYEGYLCHLALGIGVLDAPMVGVRASESSSEAMLLPWVRVVRHESAGATDRGQANRTKVLAIDVVHKDFLDVYLSEHVRPFATRFLNLVVRHQEALSSGNGAAIGLEPRIEPPPWFSRG